jgi:CBS domain-containing membrane protein
VDLPGGIDPRRETRRDLEQISEFVNSTVLAPTPPAPAAARRGSLPVIAGRRGFNNWLYSRWGNRGNAIYTFLGSLVAMLLSGGVAWATHQPLLFPSLGATAFLCFETPMAEVASTRNALIGHYVGAAIGFFWLWVFGLQHSQDAIQAGFTAGRWLAVALSLSCTGLILRLLRAAHPPAGATTIIVSLGLLHTPHQMLILALGVLLVTIPAGIFNRICGVPAPLWVKPWPGLRAFLHRPGAPPTLPPAPFMGGMLEQWRSDGASDQVELSPVAPPAQDNLPSPP